jgi:hypothetical protein
MAEGKKSFVLYCDIRNTVVKLPPQKQAELFMLILDYVNDLDPETDDLLLQIAFEPIKLQLKRDLKKWNSLREKRSEAGKIGGLKSGETRSANSKQNEANEASASTPKQNEANEAVTVTATATATENATVIETEILLKKEPKKPIKKIKVDNSLSFEDRRNDFRESLREFETEFTSKMIEDFFLYWGEKSMDGKKMRFETQKTWEPKLRLTRWKNNNFGNNQTRQNGTGKKSTDDAIREFLGG